MNFKDYIPGSWMFASEPVRPVEPERWRDRNGLPPSSAEMSDTRFARALVRLQRMMDSRSLRIAQRMFKVANGHK